MKNIKLIPLIFLILGFSKDHDKSIDKKAEERILIVNSFDAANIKGRKNKKLLFAELTDSLKYLLRSELERKSRYGTFVVPDLIQSSDSAFLEQIKKHSAGCAIIIKNLNVYFEQTDVVVEKDESGKSRYASYDIRADVEYVYVNKSGRINIAEVKSSRFFTERNVASGLLAAGPNIVVNRRDAYEILKINAEECILDLLYYLNNN